LRQQFQRVVEKTPAKLRGYLLPGAEEYQPRPDRRIWQQAFHSATA